jgi:excisionase family DNA binding protein
MEISAVIWSSQARASSTGSRDSDQLLSSDEAAEFLRISRHTLPQWRKLGRSPPYRRMGRRVVYVRKDLEAFVEALPKG